MGKEQRAGAFVYFGHMSSLYCEMTLFVIHSVQKLTLKAPFRIVADGILFFVLFLFYFLPFFFFFFFG